MSNLDIVDRLRSNRLMIPSHEAADLIEQMRKDYASLEAKMAGEIRVVVDWPESTTDCRFVEIEDTEGQGVGVGRWIKRSDGLWEIQIPSVNLSVAREAHHIALEESKPAYVG